MQSDVNDDTVEFPDELGSAMTNGTEKVTYSIKLISPLTHGGDKPRKWSITTKFSDVARLRSQIKADFGAYFDGENFEIGYIQPGHGARGQQVPIVYTEDLTCMYSRCSRTKQIVLWAKNLRKKDLPSSGSSHSRARKRPGSDNQQEVGGPTKKSKDGEQDSGSGSASSLPCVTIPLLQRPVVHTNAHQ